MRREIAIVARVDLLIRVAKQIELNFAADHRLEVQALGGKYLISQHLPRCHTDGLTSFHRKQIAQNERSFRHPRGDANGREISTRQHVAVSEVV